jgi:hypothetical protein
MEAKRETMMSAGEGLGSGEVNPMPGMRVLDWILSDSDEGPSSSKQEHASEGAKWARGLPHVCKHMCLATTKRARGSGEGGEEISLTLATTTTTARQVSLNLTACLLVL